MYTGDRTYTRLDPFAYTLIFGPRIISTYGIRILESPGVGGYRLCGHVTAAPPHGRDRMKATQILNGMCAKCGTELNGKYPRFFMPVPNRKLRTLPSKQVCTNCFADYISTIGPDTVVTADPVVPATDPYYTDTDVSAQDGEDFKADVASDEADARRR